MVDKGLKSRAGLIIVVVFVLLGILVCRLAVMQIFKGAYYNGLAMNNRTRIVSINAPRGRILDRNNVVLADNRPSYNLMALPEDISDVKGVAHRLSMILEKDEDEIAGIITKGMNRPFEPVYVARDITFEQVAGVESILFDLPGVGINAGTQRHYVYDMLGAHTLGFLGEVSADQLRNPGKEDYARGDLVGKNGVEKRCEKKLRGIKGYRIFEVDVLGRRIRVLKEEAPERGSDIKITIDKQLQAIAMNAMDGKAGSVVAMRPSDGEILALVSAPGFDPNMFLGHLDEEGWNAFIRDPMHPLQNRALRGQYPPGSIFKVVVALSGLSTGRIMHEDTCVCTGEYKVGNHTFHCWNSWGHGKVDLARGIIESCDVYFYWLGEKLGIDLIASTARAMGLGAPTGIETHDEESGLIPTKAWKLRRFGRLWQLGETIISAIGQGFVLVTPIQVAKSMSAVVNGGQIYTPRILMDSPVHEEAQLNVSKKDLDFIREALRKVVESEHGTARQIMDPDVSVGGKTGTAQVVSGYTSKRPDETDIPYKFRDHAWFFGFSPVRDPEILVACVVEHGGHGGSVAGPVVHKVIKRYFSLKKEKK